MAEQSTSFAHNWTSVLRTRKNNAQLGVILCFIAGAINAGGFLAVGQYTSHMTGVVSALADNLVLGNIQLVLIGFSMLIAFLLGAMTSTWMVNWALRRGLHSAYSRPLILEALLLILFGLFGAGIPLFSRLFVPLTVLILCFIMGLQNAVITKISQAEIRTTHVTGLVTDFGIELGRLLYLNRLTRDDLVDANRLKLRIHGLLILCFFAGGVIGAIGFKSVGYITTFPLSIILFAIAWRPVIADIKSWLDRL